MPKADLYRAIESASTILDGEETWVKKGELVKAGNPILKGREWLFEPVTIDDIVRPSVEQATSAPGEKRGGNEAAEE